MNPLDRLQELRVYQAFLALSHDRLPTAPFYLNPWTRINSNQWFDLLRSEVQASIDYLNGKRDRPHPRQRSGALIAQLRHLQAYRQEQSP